MESKEVWKELDQRDVTIKIPSRFLHIQKGEEKPLLIFLHGFADSGPGFVRRLRPALDERFEIFAPNGLFPMPQRIGREWKEAYAWYFADHEKGRVLIHPQVSAEAVAQTLQDLHLQDRRKIVCGFSQGGFFLPHLVSRLSHVEQVIAIGSGFRAADYEKYQISLPISAIHGEADDVIEISRAREQFESLGAVNQGGQFFALPKMTHTIDDAGRQIFKNLLAEVKT